MNRLFRTRRERAVGGIKRLFLAFVLFFLVLQDEGPTTLEKIARSFGLSPTWTDVAGKLVIGCILANVFAGIIGILRAILAPPETDEAPQVREADVPFRRRVTLLSPSVLVHHASAVKLVTIAAFIGAILAGIASEAETDVIAVCYAFWIVQWLLCSSLLWTSRVEVGVDGVYICRSRRFVAFTPSDTVVAKPWGFEIRRGERLAVRLRLTVREAHLRGAIGAMLADATERPRAAPADEALATLLEAQPSGAGYRTASVTREDLWRIAEAGDRPVHVRVEAIDRLAVDAQEGDAKRLEALTESSAAPELREARRAGR